MLEKSESTNKAIQEVNNIICANSFSKGMSGILKSLGLSKIYQSSEFTEAKKYNIQKRITGNIHNDPLVSTFGSSAIDDLLSNLV